MRTPLQGSAWVEVEEHGDARLDRCRAFMLVPGPLQTVQSVLNLGALSWPRKLSGLGICVLTI